MGELLPPVHTVGSVTAAGAAAEASSESTGRRSGAASHHAGPAAAGSAQRLPVTLYEDGELARPGATSGQGPGGPRSL